MFATTHISINETRETNDSQTIDKMNGEQIMIRLDFWAKIFVVLNI